MPATQLIRLHIGTFYTGIYRENMKLIKKLSKSEQYVKLNKIIKEEIIILVEKEINYDR